MDYAGFGVLCASVCFRVESSTTALLLYAAGLSSEVGTADLTLHLARWALRLALPRVATNAGPRQPSHRFRAQVGGALSRPAASFPLFEATVFEQFPYLLPCLLSSSLGLTTLVLCFFFLPETQAFVQRRAGAAQLPLSADTAPYNSIHVTRHETRADTATYHTTRAKPSSSRGAAHAACARATEPKQRRGALSA